MMNSIKIGCIAIFTLLASGCASIPSEAPELSAELGKRISAIEDANITLLHRFFDQKRQAVDEFITEEWVPTFAVTIFSDSTVAKTWETIVKENNKHDRLQFIIRMGPRLQAKINEKRLDLIQPLDDLERRIESSIREEYTQARAMNNSITSFLLSASKVAENRNRYLEMAGVTDEKIGSLIDRTDSAVSDLLSGAEKAEDKVQLGKKYLQKIREIRDSI